MKIETITGIQLYQITRMEEYIYVRNIPYSLQMKCNIPNNIAISYRKMPCIYYGRREIFGNKANQIIRILNGYAKENNKVLFR